MRHVLTFLFVCSLAAGAQDPADGKKDSVLEDLDLGSVKVEGDMIWGERRESSDIVAYDYRQGTVLGKLEAPGTTLLGATSKRAFVNYKGRLRCYGTSLDEMLWEIRAKLPIPDEKKPVREDVQWTTLDETLAILSKRVQGVWATLAIDLGQAKELWEKPDKLVFLGKVGRSFLFSKSASLVCLGRDGSSKWTQKLEGGGSFRFLEGGKLLLLEGKPRLCSGESGEEIWSREIPDFAKVKSIEVLKGKILFTWPRKSLAVDLGTGKDLWKYDDYEGEVVKVRVVGDHLAVQTGFWLYGIDPKTGKLLWDTDVLKLEDACRVKDRDCLLARKGEAYVLVDPVSGKVIKELAKEWKPGFRLACFENKEVVSLGGSIKIREMISLD